MRSVGFWSGCLVHERGGRLPERRIDQHIAQAAQETLDEPAQRASKIAASGQQQRHPPGQSTAGRSKKVTNGALLRTY